MNTRPPGIPLPLLRWRGLTLQMFFFIVLPLMALLIVIVFVSQSLHHQEMRALVGDRDLRAVRAAAGTLAQEIKSRATALEALSLQTQGSQPPDPVFLAQAAADYGFDGGLAVFDVNGRLVANTPGAALEILDYQKVLESGLLPVTPIDNARISPPVQSTDGRWLALAMTHPTIPYTLAGAFTPSALARDALSGVATPQTTVLLLSAKGDVLYQLGHFDHAGPVAEHPGVADVLRGESGVNYSPPESGGGMRGMDHTGEHVVAFSPVPPFGWGLVMEEPWEATAGPLLNLTQATPLILAPVLVLALLALWFGARQIIQPLQSLESRASRLAAGDFNAIREPAGGITEIRNLQDELIEMTAALQQAQEGLHGYIGALTAGVETERRSLARELHDDTLQALIALNQQVQMALLRAAPEQRSQLTELQNRINETIISLRRAIGGLRPIYLEDLGLTAALGMLARDGAVPENGPRIEFQVSGAERRLPPETELALYRITQEALNNAIHHARARRVQVNLNFSAANTVQLSIQDDGQGFTVPSDPGAFAHHGHYGLLGMHERADLAGAQIKIDSAPNKGTRVVVEL